MENILASLDLWFRANGLKVNAAKTQLMLLGSPQNLRTLPELKVTFREHDHIPVSEAKNLGLTFDRHLTWSDHITVLTKRCFGVLGGLSHLRGHLPPDVISVLVSALVISQVRYCVQGVPKLMAVFEKFVDPQYKLFGMTYILKNHVRGHAWML